MTPKKSQGKSRRTRLASIIRFNMETLRITLLLSMLCFPRLCDSEQDLSVSEREYEEAPNEDVRPTEEPLGPKSTLIRCINRNLKFYKIKARVGISRSLDSISHRICKKKVKLKECMVSYVDSVFPCEPHGRNMTEITIGEITSYVCYNNGFRITSMLTHGNMCIKRLMNDLQRCLYNDGEDSKAASRVCPTSEGELQRLHCRHLDEATKCAVNVLRQCNSTFPSQIIGGMSDHFKNNTHCAKYRDEIESENKSPCSGASCGYNMELTTPEPWDTVTNTTGPCVGSNGRAATSALGSTPTFVLVSLLFFWIK